MGYSEGNVLGSTPRKTQCWEEAWARTELREVNFFARSFRELWKGDLVKEESHVPTSLGLRILLGV